MGFAVNGKASNAKFEAWCNLGQRGLGAGAASQAVCDDPDMVSALGLAIGEIEDVTDDAADRRAHGVKDAERLV